ncbi:Protein of unknown function D, partial [Prunus dulcis]
MYTSVRRWRTHEPELQPTLYMEIYGSLSRTGVRTLYIDPSKPSTRISFSWRYIIGYATFWNFLPDNDTGAKSQSSEFSIGAPFLLGCSVLDLF